MLLIDICWLQRDFFHRASIIEGMLACSCPRLAAHFCVCRRCPWKRLKSGLLKVFPVERKKSINVWNKKLKILKADPTNQARQVFNWSTFHGFLKIMCIDVHEVKRSIWGPDYNKFFVAFQLRSRSKCIHRRVVIIVRFFYESIATLGWRKPNDQTKGKSWIKHVLFISLRFHSALSGPLRK